MPATNDQAQEPGAERVSCKKGGLIRHTGVPICSLSNVRAAERTRSTAVMKLQLQQQVLHITAKASMASLSTLEEFQLRLSAIKTRRGTLRVEKAHRDLVKGHFTTNHFSANEEGGGREKEGGDRYEV